MKFNFKKIASIMATTVMLGSTVAFAAAAYPAPFVNNGVADSAIVYGATSTDYSAAVDLGAALDKSVTTSSAVTAGTDKLTETEVVMGGLITATGSKILSTIEDNKLASLVDGKITWDDMDGSDDYNVHEAITIGTMKVLTTIDDKKLTGVALSNEEALEYKLIFDDALNVNRVGNDSADTLYLTIMGQQYEIEAMTNTSVTVTTSTETSMAIGESKTVANKQVTLTDVFSGSVEVSVDGKSEVIDTGETKRINGIRVHVETVGYHENAPETSKAILKIGEDISKVFSSGDEFIGQDENDPLWVWDISALNATNGYIGVKYNAKINSANDDIAGDSIKYIGEGYVFPNNYAAVTLDSLTSANYEDLKIYFEDSEDLFAASDTSTAFEESKPVLVIEGKNTDTITVNSIETDKMYVYFNETSDKFQTFYRDFDGDYTPTNKMRAANLAATAVVVNATTAVTLAQTELATIQVGDTDLDVDITVNSGIATLTITNDDANKANSDVLNLTIGGTLIGNGTAGTLARLGTLVEDAQAGDVYFNDTDVSTEDYNYMDQYGIILSKGTTVKAQADNDEVTLSIPDEQVYAQVTVSTGAVVSTSTSSIKVVKDTEIDSVKDKNLVVVGGSCINKAAAAILGSQTPLCGAAFADASGAGVGKYLVKVVASPYNAQKVAMLVAGYDAVDTVNAVNRVKAGKELTTVGSKTVYPVAS